MAIVKGCEKLSSKLLFQQTEAFSDLQREYDYHAMRANQAWDKIKASNVAAPMRLDSDQDTLQADIILAVDAVLETMSVSSKPSAVGLIDIAMHITSKHKNLTFDEIVYVLNQGRLGTYGDVHKFDIATLEKWIQAYLSIKKDMLRVKQQVYRGESISTKGESPGLRSAEIAAQRLRENADIAHYRTKSDKDE